MHFDFEPVNPDLGIAAAALADGGEAWVRWTPKLADHPAASELSDLVADFKPLDGFDAARQAGVWLRDRALELDGSTKTWLLLNDRVIQGFYALASTSVQLSTRQRKRIFARRKAAAVSQPASLVAWLARSNDSPSGTGKKLLLHAISTAESVARVQGNIALVLDAHDRETAEMWRSEYGFKKAQKGADGRANDAEQPRMWFALDGSSGA